MNFSCPLCGKLYNNFPKYQSNVERCISQNSLSPGKIQSDEVFVAKLLWDESEPERRKKEEEERLTLEFLKKDQSTHMKCLKCKEQYFFKELQKLQCGGKCCHSCLKNHIQEQMKAGVFRMKCVVCSEHELSQQSLRSILSEEEFEDLEEKQLYEFMKSNADLYFFCPNKECGKGFERVIQSQNDLVNSLKRSGNQSPSSAQLHHEQYRFMCRSCKTEFCSGCMTSPYHENFTCEDFKRHKVKERCRFCDEPVEALNTKKDALRLICKECCTADKHKWICTKQFRKCKHFCMGVRNEKNHLPCLDAECVEKMKKKKKKKRLDQNADDFCNICYVEGLGAAPCIRLKCGHVFHHKCCLDKIYNGWGGPAITFGFLNCPLCKAPMDHSELKDALKSIHQMRKTILKKGMTRLKFEGLNKSDDLCKKSGKFYKKPKEFIIKKLAYYQCFKCRNPYFGGMRSCEEAAEDRDFKKEELLCGACAAKQIGLTKTCPLHGHEFIEYKCRFCCNISCWFCWGSTHFCHDCHKIQVKTQKLTKTPKSQLPKCKGGRKCPSGANHPPNGEEFALGCTICRRNAEF